MKKGVVYYSILLLIIYGCNSKSDIKTIDDSPIVATKISVNGSPVISCDLSLLNDTIDFPISTLVEDLEIIILENSDSALVSRYHTFTSENYIGIYTLESQYKLFDKEGNLICFVGRKGIGPGEYIFIYDSYIDEENERIYLMPWMQKKIFIYDLKGKLIKDIPLPEFVPKARFKIDAKNEIITILILPFKDRNEYAIWQIDFEGNIIKSIDSSFFAQRPDYGNEVISYRNTNNIDYYIAGYPFKQDSLFYYIPEENKLQPLFTLQFGNVEPFFHCYVDLPNHVLTILSAQDQIDKSGQFYKPMPDMFIVEKESLKGSWVNIVVDELGNIPIPTSTLFQDGYFVANMYPHELKQSLEKILTEKENTLSQVRKDKINSLYNQIDEDGNNIILMGRLKQ